MKTIEELWQEFRRMAAPPNASEMEIRERSKTFYAGAIAMFFAVTDLGDDEVPEHLAELQLVHFQNEIAAYIAAVKENQEMKGDKRVKH